MASFPVASLPKAPAFFKSDGQKESWKPGEAEIVTSASGYRCLRWRPQKGDALEIVVTSVGQETEAPVKKAGWLSGRGEAPTWVFTVTAIWYRDLMISLQHRFAPPSPHTYYIGFSSLRSACADSDAWYNDGLDREAARVWHHALDPAASAHRITTAASRSTVQVDLSGPSDGSSPSVSKHGQPRALSPESVRQPEQGPRPVQADKTLEAQGRAMRPNELEHLQGKGDGDQALPLAPGAAPSANGGKVASERELERRMEALRQSEMQSRLNKLKGVRTAKVEDDELQARFAALKGISTAGQSVPRTIEQPRGPSLQGDTAIRFAIDDDEIEALMAEAQDGARLGGGGDTGSSFDGENGRVDEGIVEILARGGLHEGHDEGISVGKECPMSMTRMQELLREAKRLTAEDAARRGRDDDDDEEYVGRAPDEETGGQQRGKGVHAWFKRNSACRKKASTVDGEELSDDQVLKNFEVLVKEARHLQQGTSATADDLDEDEVKRVMTQARQWMQMDHADNKGNK